MILPKKKSFRSVKDIKNYHVHIYYDGNSKQRAAYIRQEVVSRFKGQAEVGRWRDKAPQGPHPLSHFQISFEGNIFSEIVSFLALNRGGLHILLHPNTGDGYEDHTQNVMWIGPSIQLNNEWLKKNQGKEEKINK